MIALPPWRFRFACTTESGTRRIFPRVPGGKLATRNSQVCPKLLRATPRRPVDATSMNFPVVPIGRGRRPRHYLLFVFLSFSPMFNLVDYFSLCVIVEFRAARPRLAARFRTDTFVIIRLIPFVRGEAHVREMRDRPAAAKETTSIETAVRTPIEKREREGESERSCEPAARLDPRAIARNRNVISFTV